MIPLSQHFLAPGQMSDALPFIYFIYYIYYQVDLASCLYLLLKHIFLDLGSC